MTATDVLRGEHEVIQRVLNVLDRAASNLEAGGTVPRETRGGAGGLVEGRRVNDSD